MILPQVGSIGSPEAEHGQRGLQEDVGGDERHQLRDEHRDHARDQVAEDDARCSLAP